MDVVDALDEKAVDEHVTRTVSRSGSVDVSFNLISRGDVQQIPLVDMTMADLRRAVTNGLESNFITARAAARRMIEQGSRVILHLNSGSAMGTMPLMGSTGPAVAATETFMRYLATEVMGDPGCAAQHRHSGDGAFTGTIVNVTSGLLPG